MSRLGNPFIDLYILAVNRIGRLSLRAREQADEIGGDLIADYLNLLATQQTDDGTGLSSFRELAAAAQNFDLIVTVNEPAARDEPLERATTIFGRLLRAQQPVGGMFGKVNETLVRQFRMPGYPLVLVTTDLLQEGEDLHTFCSSVHHYGISWMPSSMEQRIGRIDRVSSQTDRRLTALQSDATGDQLLQVYYPHLRDTVEVLQVGRVLERLNRFMLLMHEDLGGREPAGSEIDTASEMIRENRHVKQLDRSLKSAFPIQDHLLRARQRRLAVDREFADNIRKRFHSLRDQLDADSKIRWEEPSSDHTLFGTLTLPTRFQPFTLLLRSVSGLTAIRCVSPVGLIDLEDRANDIQEAARESGIRIGAVYDERFRSYNLTMEGDVLLGEERSDAARCRWLLHRVTAVADRLEHLLLGIDQPMATFETDLQLETIYER